jgi:hypothetical protein
VGASEGGVLKPLAAKLFLFCGVALLLLAQAPGTFTPGGNMTAAHRGHTATLLPNGKVLITGGFQFSSSAQSVLASAELYDPYSSTFSATGSKPRAAV